MAFEYLWDRKDNVLIVRFPAAFARRAMVGLMISVDDGAGRHAPSLAVPLSPSRLAEELYVFLLAPLPASEPGRRLYVTVEPVCSVDSEDPVPAERLVLAPEESPEGAATAYWLLDASTTPPLLAVDAVAPDYVAETALVAQSARHGDVIHPAKAGYTRSDGGTARVTLSIEEDAGALNHVIRIDGPGDRRETDAATLSLVAATDACKALLSGDGAAAHPHSAAPKPLPRNGEPAIFHIRAEPPPAAGSPYDEATPCLQFLDRVVVDVQPAGEVEVFREGRRIAELRSPVVLADMGGGILEPDAGRLRTLLLAANAENEGADAQSGQLAAGLFPFVEAVRRRTLERIIRALPSAAELRPVDIASMRENASFYQALAWLELPIDPARHGPLRQALRNRDSEVG